MSDKSEPSEKVEQLQSELNNALKELEFCRNRFRNVIEHTPSGVCITDENGIFDYVNSAYCKIYGYEPDELLGNSFLMVVPEHEREMMEKLHREYIEGRDEIQGEWEVVNSRGERLTVLADATRITERSGRKFKATFITDITRRRRIEELKDDVGRMTRHDLRNPISSLIHLPELMRDFGPLTDEQSELMELVRVSGKRMLNMLSMSMDLFKMEEGTYKLNCCTMSLPEIIKVIVSEITIQMQIDPSAFTIESDLSDMDLFYGDKTLIESLFYNLIINAFEAYESSGKKFPVTVSCSKMDKDITVKITNSGEVPAEIRDRFFEKYVTAKKIKGTGIGTYMAFLAVKAHGGEIKVDCTTSGQTTIFVCLPLES